MAGIGTTMVEAMHLSSHGIGVEYEARWATIAADNIRLATHQGATGHGEIYQGESGKELDQRGTSTAWAKLNIPIPRNGRRSESVRLCTAGPRFQREGSPRLRRYSSRSSLSVR